MSATDAARSRRRAVLEALREAGAAGVSGEALARALGVSRAAVAKHVAALVAAGYGIAASPGSGYTLVSAPDLPLPDEVASLLRSAIWSRLEGGMVTESTNDDCKALARAGAPEGTAVLAAEQTAGRGRLGREWSSPPGGVYVSALLRPPMPAAAVSALSPATALGIARGLRALGADVGVKWPNDVMLGGDKVAGVLLEMSAEADRVEWVVAGCGVDVHPPAERFPGAAYLVDALPEVRLAEVAAAVLDGLARAYVEMLAGGFGALVPEYRRFDALAGTSVEVRDGTGAIVTAGKADGVDDAGRLLVLTPDGTARVSSGEVTLRR
ncbi:MAG: biotin--[acetyl-CoA-carboxylase] ligase [Coriobacteriia bacterium]